MKEIEDYSHIPKYWKEQKTVVDQCPATYKSLSEYQDSQQELFCTTNMVTGAEQKAAVGLL